MTADPVHAPAPDATRRIAEAAHEIRTPLGGVLALADLLLAEDLTDAARGHASALKTAAEHLLSVSTALLGGAAPARPDILDLDRFLERVAAPIAARAAVKGLAFRALRGPGVPDRLLAAEAPLRQVIDNLADNALRVTETGAIEVAIERVAEDMRCVTLRIAVRDTGPGLGDDPERLFAPFVQGEGAHGAAGLGLAVVARIAERLDGRAEAANRPDGRGAEVSVIVRLERLQEPRSASGAGLSILVAEDNAVNQRVLSTLLDHFGHAYDIVSDGAAAIEAAQARAYDLVLMDAVMPGVDGLEATRAIRKLGGAAAATRIVGVTARAFDDDLTAFLAAGADAVVTKPISVAELWRAISATTEETRKAG